MMADRGGLRVRATNPESGTISYVYNADSILSTKTYNNGNYQQYSYDAYQRLTEIQGFVYNSPQHYTEDASERQTFIYDSLNGVSYPGLLTEATFASGLDTTNAWTLQNQYTYTAAGQVATKALSVSNGAATASGLLTTSYTYDGLGTLISTQYPSPNSLTFTYALDGLERPIGLTDNTNHTWVSGVLYNPASQMTNATFPSGTETWGYNLLNQLMQRTTTSGSTTRMNMAYNYTAGKDNGQIAGSADAVTGETITYLYDSLKRLAKASSGTWSDTYTYDGFGNLTGMTGSGGAPSLSVSVNPATNQITPTNVLYDGNGNVTQFSPSGSLMTLGYDVVNRMASVNSTNAYAYSPANQRVYFRSSATGTETLYVYGTDGKKLATYTIAGITGSQVNFAMQNQNVYFAGKLISAEGNAVAVDRLGTVRWNATSGGHTYYPYGAEYSATLNDTEKYATYTRDTLTGLDYAMNRYYSSPWGRFMTPDRSWSSARPGNPQSWNLYAYAVNDPVNGNDPSGNDTYVIDDDGTIVGSCDDDGNCTYYAGINDITVYPGPDDPTPLTPEPADPPPPPVSPVPPDTPDAPDTPDPPPPALSLAEVNDCTYPQGTSILPGTWTLEVEYQVLVDGQAVFGNTTLTNDGVSTVSEKVTTTSGGPITGGGVWCLATAACPSHGSLTSSGMFWDVLAGNGTANQSFLIGGQLIPVSFAGTAGSPTVLKNLYNSAGSTISVNSGALVGNSSTPHCENVHLGPPWH
jgi:RHS repeat-associated protein